MTVLLGVETNSVWSPDAQRPPLV